MRLIKKAFIGLGLFFPFLQTGLFAQLRAVSMDEFQHWESVSNGDISGDGEWVIYQLDNRPISNKTLVVKNTNHNVVYKFVNTYQPTLFNDLILFKKKNDSLCLFNPSSKNLETILNVVSFSVIEGPNGENWLIYLRKDKKLSLRNLKSAKSLEFDFIEKYTVSDSREHVLIISSVDGEGCISVDLFSLKDQIRKTIFRGNSQIGQPENGVVFSSNLTVALLMKNRQNGKSIKYINTKDQRFNQEISNKSGYIDTAKYEIDGNLEFSKKGEVLFFQIKRKQELQKVGFLPVDVWSYKDDKLQSQQLVESKYPIYLSAVYNSETKSVHILTNENESFVFPEKEDKFILVRTNECYFMESNWRSACKPSIYVVSTTDGSRRLVKANQLYNFTNCISPEGKYIVYYDFEEGSYFSYNTSTGKIINISNKIPHTISSKEGARAGTPIPYGGINIWMKNDEAVFIYDQFDIWLADPSGNNQTICVTNQFGRRKGIEFRFVNEGVIASDTCILTAFHKTLKNNGFFKINCKQANDPDKLIFDPYLYYWPGVGGMKPIKARNDKGYIIGRMNAKESFNLYYTKNFKHFSPVSNVYPEREYNWITSELINWRLPNSKMGYGILYKPSNFDSTKKYPVIINIYENRSDELHLFTPPAFSGDNINIPHFVSNNYVVFVPDMNFDSNEISDNISQTLLSATERLKKYSWVDVSKLGLQGHSFGGFEVHSIITQTNIFSAAASASGSSDLISNTLSVDQEGGYSLAYLAETLSYRIGGTVWDKKQSYIYNSPVLFANKIETPLLLMNNMKDGVVPFSQGIELFTALRRLNKEAWLLQYDGQGHQLVSRKSRTDYTIRLFQFFDHYLKSAPAPIWMTQGIPARLKGIVTGYDLDPAGNCGKDCKVCKMWNEKWAKDSAGTRQEIQDKIKTEHWMGGEIASPINPGSK